MADTATGPSEQCAQCAAPAAKSCSGCSEAAVSVESGSKTFYCGPICQKAGWEEHKSECKRLKALRNLYQGGHLLRQLWLVLRAQSFPSDLDKVVLDGEKITVFETVDADSGPYSLPFAHSLFTNDAVKDTVLSYMACAEAMTNMRSLTYTVLSGVCNKFEEIKVSIDNPDPKVVLFNRKGPNKPYRKVGDGGTVYDVQHCFFRVRLKHTADLFAVDVTGGQYGYTDTIIPWQECTERKAAKVLFVHPWGTFTDRVATADPCCHSEANRRYEDMVDFTARRLEKLFDDWMRQNNITMSELINSKKSASEQKVSEVVAYTAQGLTETHGIAKQCGDLLIMEQTKKQLDAREELHQKAGLAAYLGSDWKVRRVINL